jgi:hypothetical protein
VVAAVILAALCVVLISPAAGVSLTGRVIDAASGTPIVGARVLTCETGETAMSDSSGAYRLTTHHRGSLVVVSSGDTDIEVRVHAQRDSLVHDFLLFHRAVSAWRDFLFPDAWEQIPRRASAAVTLALDMDAQRPRELLWTQPSPVASAIHDVVRIDWRVSGIWDHYSIYYRVSPREVGIRGWEHALSQIPGIVVR